jgi:myo-inositol-1(or 4)-monophosphatase
MLRPKEANREPWWRVAERAARIRILSCSALETVLVCTGATDAFVDAGSETHRIMDLAPGVALARAAGVRLGDALGRPIELDSDLTRRWSGIVAATEPLCEEISEALAVRSPG